MHLLAGFQTFGVHGLDQALLLVSGFGGFVDGLVFDWNGRDSFFFDEIVDVCCSLNHRVFVDTNDADLGEVLKVRNREFDNTVAVWSLIENLEWRKT